MSSPSRFIAHLPLALLLMAGFAAPATSAELDKRFFDQIQGQWTGPGEIVAGKYKGTKFVCNFADSTPEGKVGMSLDGTCRAGMFSQEMSARVEQAGSTYRGAFLDGAAGKGLDVVSGLVKEDQAVFGIHRKQLTGAMRAQMTGADKMNVTVSVHVDEELVPVIGISLRRLDPRTVAAN